MTLPSSPNSISVSQINTEIGSATTTSRTLQYLNGLIKPAQRPASPNMDAFRGKAWYRKTNAGNCNNGNCNCEYNCGIYNCLQCFPSQCVNCVNCDAQNFLQTNCNCACTYNCNANLASYDCDCATC